MCRYLDHFNGERIWLIRDDERTVDIEDGLFGPGRYIHIENDPELGESKGFVDAISTLPTTGNTFYAHTKGVRYVVDEYLLTPIIQWRNNMYRACLDDIGAIDEALKTYSCAGAYKNKNAEGFWHYSGNYWWVNNNQLFSHNWRRIDNNYYGVENYLGYIFPQKDAFCLAYGDVLAPYFTPDAESMVSCKCRTYKAKGAGPNMAGVCFWCRKPLVYEGRKL